jgi:hypothetical protein
MFLLLRIHLTRITTNRGLHKLRINLLPRLLHLPHKSIIGILIPLMVPLLIMVLNLSLRIQLERHQTIHRLLTALGLEGDGGFEDVALGEVELELGGGAGGEEPVVWWGRG